VRFSRGDEDFDRHLAYTDFFRKCGIPVPGLLKADPGKKEAEFEDLGDLSLYGWSKCIRPEQEMEAMYAKVIDIAVLIHTAATLHATECPLITERIFDYDHLRWETAYFVENCVSRIRDIRSEDTSRLEQEFHRLAVRVDSFPKMVIHRDLQSQNLMVTRGGIPRLIDYQGARLGPPAYDMASLLWDPYYRLEGRLRERLLSYYIARMKEKNVAGFDEGAFRDSLLPCRLQRHMQALGAYGFLSSVKGKKYFLKHMDEGLKLLKEETFMVKDEFPALYELALVL
jgi:aminoglycoside/choline kinase family phosphotransferase